MDDHPWLVQQSGDLSQTYAESVSALGMPPKNSTNIVGDMQRLPEALPQL